jgi:hypothetical protein
MYGAGQCGRRVFQYVTLKKESFTLLCQQPDSTVAHPECAVHVHSQVLAFPIFSLLPERWETWDVGPMRRPPAHAHFMSAIIL